MLYVIKWEYSDFKYLLLGLGIVLCCIYFFRSKNHIKYYSKYNNVNIRHYFMQLINIFLIVILSIIFVLGLGEKIYSIISYNCGNYEIVEGSVSDFENIYAHNSTQIRGISFVVDEVSFILDRGSFNSGYPFDGGIISDNHDKLRIYYLPPHTGDTVDLILRIDLLD